MKTHTYRHDNSNVSREFISRAIRALLHSPIGLALLRVSRLFYPQKTGDWLDISSYTFQLPRLDPEFDGLKLAQISDIHIGTWISRKQLAQAVDMVNACNPDIVILTGDFVTFEPERFVCDLSAELSRLSPRITSLAILGNHDHWTNAQLIRNILAQSNIRDLSNRVYTLTRGHKMLHIAGVDDYMNGCDRLDLVLEQLPDQGAAILLSHEPDFADIAAETHRFDLQLSGHTHGGQVNLPWVGPPFLPGYGRKYYNGTYHVNGMIQHTNRGLGTAELQIRLRCRPEISVITLSPVMKNTNPDSF